VRQGRATGRNCLIRARVGDNAILVGGAAETAA
jgi:predicted PhzF superfamily epimerase YddE/YHI9